MSTELPAGAGLDGRRVVIAEDNALLSLQLRQWVSELGCTVAASASRIGEAQRQCETLPFDVAVLDINLRGHTTYALAEALLARGQPFVLASGYSATALPPALRAAPLLQKPYRRQDLEAALRQALHTHSGRLPVQPRPTA